MPKYFDETVRPQSEKIGEWIREIRERLQGIAEGASSAPHLASSSAASFPGRNERPGTYCSLIEQERTGWRGQNESQIVGEEKRNGRLVGAAETSKEREEWRRLQRKNLSILGLPKRKEWPQCHRESSWQERRSRPCQKKKEKSRQSKVPDREGERVKLSESRTLARETGIRARAWRGKGGLHSEKRQIPSRKRRASKKR